MRSPASPDSRGTRGSDGQDDLGTPESRSRWELIRDVVVFQMKLAVDASRDIALVPVSLVAGVVDIVTARGRRGENFYAVLRLGRRTERWINLFGAAEEPAGDEVHSLDALVGQAERLLVEQYERGGVTAAAKEAIDRSLDRIGDLERPGNREDDPPASSATVARVRRPRRPPQ